MDTGDKLTYDEAINIVKAVTAYNSGQLTFVPDYLKYAGQLELNVERTEETITITIPLGGM